MEMTAAFHRAETVPDEVRADSYRALDTHPNVVLLPVGFTIGGYVDGSWRPKSFDAYPTPQAARDAGSYSIVRPRMDESTTIDEFTAACERVRAAHQPPRTDDFEMNGVPCRVTRVETFVRVGPDGPEGPRPSDHDSQPPPARHVADLRAQGLMPSTTTSAPNSTAVRYTAVNRWDTSRCVAFIIEWYGELQTAEKIVRQWGLSPAESSTGFIDQAGAAWPGIIANRANLLRLGANAYRTLRENMANQVKDLQQSGPALRGARRQSSVARRRGCEGIQDTR